MFLPAGIAAFRDHVPGDQRDPRIVLDALVGSCLVSFIVDTGAHWSVLRRRVAEGAGLLPCKDDPTTTVVLRGVRLDGRLVRGAIRLLASPGHGTDLEIEGTFFVPDEDWGHPSFLGWCGALERVRFAVDPVARRFAFAPAAGEVEAMGVRESAW